MLHQNIQIIHHRAIPASPKAAINSPERNNDRLVRFERLMDKHDFEPTVSHISCGNCGAEGDAILVNRWIGPTYAVCGFIPYIYCQGDDRRFRYKDASGNLTPTVRELELAIGENTITAIGNGCPIRQIAEIIAESASGNLPGEESDERDWRED